MHLIVLAHSHAPLTTPLPVPGQQAIAQVEQHAPQRLVALVENCINDGTTTVYQFATWAELAEAAKRLMTISMFNAVTPAEQPVLTAWRAGALNASMAGARKEISVAWANCGETAKNVLTRLRVNYGATISHMTSDTFTAATIAGLNAALTQTPPGAGEIYILDCDLQGVHNFLVEVHSNGDRYLIQGYQGAYSAPWWVSDGLYEPTAPESDLADVVNLRPVWGAGVNIGATYANLLPILATLVQQGYSAAHAGATAWPQLPFKPSDPAPTKIRDLPYLQVDRFVLRNPGVVYGNMPGVAGSVCAQAVRSLPVVPPVVNVAEVQHVIGHLGLAAAHTTEVRTGDSKFKVTADLLAPAPTPIVNKVLLRVGAHGIDVVTRNDLPAQGQLVEVGYMQAGLEVTVNRVVQ